MINNAKCRSAECLDWVWSQIAMLTRAWNYFYVHPHLTLLFFSWANRTWQGFWYCVAVRLLESQLLTKLSLSNVALVKRHSTACGVYPSWSFVPQDGTSTWYIYVCVFAYVDLKVVGQAGALRIAADIVSPGVETTRCCEANTPTTVHR